jgi:hypothetical protein
MEIDEDLPVFLVKSTNAPMKVAKPKKSKQIVLQPTRSVQVPQSLCQDPLLLLNKDLALHILSFLRVPEILEIATVSRQVI